MINTPRKTFNIYILNFFSACVSYSVVKHFYHTHILGSVSVFWSNMAAVKASGGARLLCQMVGTVVLDAWQRKVECDDDENGSFGELNEDFQGFKYKHIQKNISMLLAIFVYAC